MSLLFAVPVRSRLQNKSIWTVVMVRGVSCPWARRFPRRAAL